MKVINIIFRLHKPGDLNMQLSLRKIIILIISISIHFGLFAQTVPSVPVLDKPYSGSSDIPLNIILYWHTENNADYYNIEVSQYSDFSVITFSQNNITDTLIQVSPNLNSYTTYYWRVEAHNTSGGSGWSDVWNFYTGNGYLPDTPVLSSPANSTTDVPIGNVVFTWNYANYADSYTLQVSTNPSFTEPILFNASGITEYTQSVTINSQYTNHYWRVSAQNSYGSSKWSDSWYFATGSSSTAPDIPVLNSPENGSYNISVENIILEWNAASGAENYDLQVATNSSFSAPLAIDYTYINGTLQTISSLEPNTTYYWHVESRNSNGQVSGWSNFWYFTTGNDTRPPTTPRLIGPYNRDVGLPTNITLFWEKSSGANSYDVQVATDYNFSYLAINNTDIANESYKVYYLDDNTEYYWRVRAVNDNGYSDWSEHRRFYTWSGSGTPSAPELLGPEYDQTGLPFDLTFIWEYTRGADNYDLQVSTTQDFTNIVININDIDQNWYKASGTELTDNTDYYWCVKASNESGDSWWSETRHFTTGGYNESPDYPYLVGPNSGDTNLPSDATLVWDYAAGTDYYRLQISRDYSFTDIVYDQSGILFPRSKIEGLDFGQTYYWNVKAYNSHGESSWSSVWNFQTDTGYPVPDTPSLINPYDNTTDQPSCVFFQWYYSKGADVYNLQIATDRDFYNIKYEEYGIPNTSRSVPLDSYTTYYWRVESQNQNGSSWSNSWVFTTGEGGPGPGDAGPPLLFGPKNCETDIPTDVTLFWLHDESITSFDVEIASDPNFTNIEQSQYNINSMSYTFSGLNPNQVLYWHARTSMNGTLSKWSQTWCFVTGDGTIAPAAPRLFGPYNDNYDLPPDLTLFWEYATGAQTYQVQISSSYDFTNIVYDETDLDLTWKKVSGLSWGNEYYWRVRASNNSGYGMWSEIWHFSVGSGYTYPDPPSLIKPYDYDSGLPTSLQFEWNYGNGADFYTLEIATDASFTNIYTSMDQLPLHVMPTDNLSTNMSYYWRVKSINSYGESNWSEEWEFYTWDGSSYPYTPSLQSPDNNANIFSMNALFEWERSWGAESYHLQVANDYDFYDIVYEESNLTDTKIIVPLPYSDHRYYWRVEAQNNMGSSGWTGYWEFNVDDYPSDVTIWQDYYFPEQPGTRHYKIIGIPGDERISLEEILGQGGHNQSWDAYWDNGADGSPEEYLERFDPYNSNFSCVVGRAFWVIANHNFTINRTLESAPASNGYAVINLHSGWNMITNPFNYNVNWDDVKDFNSLYSSEPLWEYNEGFSTSNTMYPGTGYYYDNQYGLNRLQIPYDPSSSVYKHSVNDDIQWEATIALYVDDLKDISTSFGVAKGASSGKDYFDYKKPRAVGKLPTVSFEREEWKNYSGSYARDMRAPIAIEKIEIWDFNVNILDYKNAKLTFNGINDIPSIFDIYLIDKERSKIVDLREQSSYDFQAVKENSDFEICVGNKESIEEELEKYLPKKYELGKNYPNPFNPITMIPFSLPDASEISLLVYNILGQTVRTLYRGRMDAGKHYIAFDGKDQNGNRLSSGLYFYRLTTDKGHNFVNKMVLIK
jgi:hypothetical protein